MSFPCDLCVSVVKTTPPVALPQAYDSEWLTRGGAESVDRFRRFGGCNRSGMDRDVERDGSVHSCHPERSLLHCFRDPAGSVDTTLLEIDEG